VISHGIIRRIRKSFNLWEDIMSIVIALLQKKGGAGKTTTAINLLGAFREKGLRAYLCDMDKAKPDAIFWTDNGAILNDYVVPLFEDNPKKKVEELRKESDIILIDPPPNFEAAALKAAMLCDIAIIPSGAAMIDRESLKDAASCAMMAEKPYYFLASRITKNTKLTKDLLSQIEATKTSFSTYITHSVAMVECQNSGNWVGGYAPGSPNHIQYLQLADEILNKVGFRHGQ
jgi:chromosome partitioning protein